MSVSEAALDPRNVANLMLNETDRLSIQLTKLALQNLLYFAPGVFLNERKRHVGQSAL